MTRRIQELQELIRSGGHHLYRRTMPFPPPDGSQKDRTSHMERVCDALCRVLEAERPVLLPGERIHFLRTVQNLPELLTEYEQTALWSQHYRHEAGRVCNISPDYGEIIAHGLLPKRDLAEKKLAEGEGTQLHHCIIRSIDAVLELVERYRQALRDTGDQEGEKILGQVPARGARTFHEALQSLRILHFILWCEGEYHNTLGRFDQYLYPYLQADLESGRLDEEGAFELLEEFFLSLNRDSDLYPGIQQGDNGQSLMLGGVDADGNSCFNHLSELCLEASRELALIDPKINLRVDKTTPLWVYEKGTQLTKAGLGFPQYSNDDVVIPGLLDLGYSLKDARNYTVAACWEFIIPAAGMDIPNIGAVNFPEIVNEAILEDLDGAADYRDFFDCVRGRIGARCRALANSVRGVYMLPAPFLSILMEGCLERGRDISEGGRYNNYGLHGVGVSTAVDSLYNLRELVFERGELSSADVCALLTEEEDSEDLLPRLRYDMPKFGDDEDHVDDIAVELLATFADALEGLKNDRGGCFRAGTGSAMFYLWYAQNVGNALSGHRRGDAFSANYAPELFARNKGPLSVIRSFTKPNLRRVVNGGPLTMEFHGGLFRDQDSVRKVASLVQAFVRSGGHQLQLNAVDRETMLAAQREPAQHKNLIVRIWGWSAYFVELDREYQDHVISRQEFTV